MKRLLLIIFGFYFLSSYAQQTYSYQSIPYNPYPFQGGIQLASNTDDIYSEILPIGFDFNFYGSDYGWLVIGTNGTINFDTTNANDYNAWPIATIPDDLPPNSIMFPFHDMDVSVGAFVPIGTIWFALLDTAPFRKFIVSFDSVPMFSCNTLTYTGQVVLHETTNTIEVNMKQKETCSNWNSGNAILGLVSNNLSYTIVSGRSIDNDWDTYNEAWRFCPNGNCTGSPPDSINLITGHVYIDVNNNCQFDTSDLPSPHITVVLNDSVITQTDQSGFYAFTMDTGNYIVKAMSHVTCTGDSTYNGFFNLLGDSSINNDFNTCLYYQLISASICNGDSIFAGGTYQGNPGSYYDTFANALGCDTVMITNLSFNNSFHTTTIIICSNDSVFLGDAWQNTAGLYYDTLTSINNCDSIVETNLSILFIPETIESTAICDGDSILFGSRYFTTQGYYSDTFQSTEGCDSIVSLDLVVNDVDTAIVKSGQELSANVVNETYQWYDCNLGLIISGDTSQNHVFSGNGNYAVIVTQNGCTDTSRCIEILGVSVNELSLSLQYNIYPNPAKDELVIELQSESLNINKPGKIRLWISSLSGKIIKKYKLNSEYANVVDIADLNTGLYILSIQSSEMKSAYFKFAKIE